MKKIVISSIALTLLAVACGEEELTDPTPVKTPAVVLKKVELSFNERNITYLKENLSENFVFHFDPDDVGQNPPGGSKYVIPESWEYTVFWQTVLQLLENAFSVSLRIYVGPVNEPGPEQEISKAENVSLKLVVMYDEVNGFLVDNGYCDFEFERCDSGGGERVWRLTKWWDNTSFPNDGNPSLSPVSLGRVLALFK